MAADRTQRFLPMNVSRSLGGITASHQCDIDHLVEVLQEYGIVILPHYVGDRDAVQLNREFDRIFDTRRHEAQIAQQDGTARTVSVRRSELGTDEAPGFSALFAAPLMANVAAGFFRPGGYRLNETIIFNENTGTPAPLNVLPFIAHFDKHHTLKFFIYLTDTNMENGAMAVAPGSHHANRVLRERALAAGRSPSEVASLVDSDDLVPVEGGAGTMLIFDTDMTHRAGHVRSGLVRRIVRGHTWACPPPAVRSAIQTFAAG
jgi:hypothetical protein